MVGIKNQLMMVKKVQLNNTIAQSKYNNMFCADEFLDEIQILQADISLRYKKRCILKKRVDINTLLFKILLIKTIKPYSVYIPEANVLACIGGSASKG
jgi:hypothetical protein